MPIPSQYPPSLVTGEYSGGGGGLGGKPVERRSLATDLEALKGAVDSLREEWHSLNGRLQPFCNTTVATPGIPKGAVESSRSAVSQMLMTLALDIATIRAEMASIGQAFEG